MLLPEVAMVIHRAIGLVRSPCSGREKPTPLPRAPDWLLDIPTWISWASTSLKCPKTDFKSSASQRCSSHILCLVLWYLHPSRYSDPELWNHTLTSHFLSHLLSGLLANLLALLLKCIWNSTTSYYLCYHPLWCRLHYVFY